MPGKAMKRKAARRRTRTTGPSNGDLFAAAVMGGLVIAAALAYTYGWGLDSFNIADFKFDMPRLGLPEAPHSN